MNASGDLAAQKTGDVQEPPLERRAPDAELVASCGDGALTEAGQAAVRREPYLQRVTAGSALVLWTAARSTAPAVELSTPDGTVLARVPAQKDPGAPPGQYVATLGELAADRIYCYRLIDGDEALSGRTGFRTAPPPGTGRKVQFVAFGDSGDGSEDQFAVLDQILQVPFDLLLHTGDIAYGKGTRREFEDKFFAVYAPILRSVPIFPASGNHEYMTDDAAPYREVFALPENGGERGRERWFSFDWGDVHFVALDTEASLVEQAAWLDRDLSMNRLPWVVVYFHRPAFSSGEHKSHEEVRRAFWPVLEKHRVPLVLVGHDHDYERTHPQGGVIQVVTGGGGRGTRPVGKSSFTAFAEAVLHFVHVTIEGDTLTLRAIDATGREFDGLKIVRPPGPQGEEGSQRRANQAYPAPTSAIPPANTPHITAG